jgi:hypothetical protein
MKDDLVTGVKLSESTASSNSGRKLGMQYTILVVSPHHTDASAGAPRVHNLSAFALPTHFTIALMRCLARRRTHTYT